MGGGLVEVEQGIHVELLGLETDRSAAHSGKLRRCHQFLASSMCQLDPECLTRRVADGFECLFDGCLSPCPSMQAYAARCFLDQVPIPALTPSKSTPNADNEGIVFVR